MARKSNVRTTAFICWLVVVAFITNASESTAKDLTLADIGWNELTIPGKTPSQFRLTEDRAIAILSDASVSVLFRTLTSQEEISRILVWRWRVDVSVPATNPAEVGKDDRDLAVHVWFADNEAEGLWEYLGDAIKNVLGIPQIGKVLTYVFGGTGERYRRLVNPHHDPDGVIVILRPSGTKTGKWFSERVNFVADFEQAFGKAPPNPKYVAISADSDDTKSYGAGRIAGLMFQ